jgi:hypothetical protein
MVNNIIIVMRSLSRAIVLRNAQRRATERQNAVVARRQKRETERDGKRTDKERRNRLVNVFASCYKIGDAHAQRSIAFTIIVHRRFSFLGRCVIRA